MWSRLTRQGWIWLALAWRELAFIWLKPACGLYLTGWLAFARTRRVIERGLISDLCGSQPINGVVRRGDALLGSRISNREYGVRTGRVNLIATYFCSSS